jgi:uncharacterized protein YceK
MSLRTLAPVALLSTLLLAGCGAIVPMTSAKEANSPECATVTVRLPAEVAGQAKRETNAQATGAWGTPASILLHCGVAVPGPTTLPCVEINGIDWIEDDKEKPLYRYTTFGRVPAVEVVVDSDKVSGTTTLVDLAGTLSQIPATERCTDLSDTFKN